MKKIYLFILIITLIATLTFISIISNSVVRAERANTKNDTAKNNNQSITKNEIQINDKNTMTLALLGKPKTLNEATANDDSSMVLINHLFIPLFIYGNDKPEWSLIPADKEKSKSGKGYDIKHIDEDKAHTELEIYLRDDIVWSDGEKMTSDDWVWYFNNVVCNKEINHPAYQNTLIQMNEWEKRQTVYKKIDEYSFKIVFPRIIAEPELLGNSQPMPKHIAKPILEKNGIDELRRLWNINTTDEQDIVSNGCFKFKSYNNSNIVLEQNEDFFLYKDSASEKKNISYIQYEILYDIQSILDGTMLPAKFSEYIYFNQDILDALILDKTSMLELSEIKNQPVELDKIKTEKKNKYKLYKRINQNQNDYMSFNQNTNSNHFKDEPHKIKWFKYKKFRQAISLLINREKILSDIYKDTARINDSLLPDNSPYFNSNIRFDTEYNPDKALELLRSIGIDDNDGDGLLEDDEDNRIEFEILTNNIPDRVSIAKLINDELNNKGISSTISTKSFTLLVSKILDNNWDCVIIGFTLNPFPLTYENLFHSRGNMHIWNPEQWKPSTEWENKINELFSEYEKESIFSTRRRIINDLLTIFYEQLPIIPLIEKHSYLLLEDSWSDINKELYYSFGYSNFERVSD